MFLPPRTQFGQYLLFKPPRKTLRHQLERTRGIWEGVLRDLHSVACADGSEACLCSAGEKSSSIFAGLQAYDGPALVAHTSVLHSAWLIVRRLVDHAQEVWRFPNGVLALKTRIHWRQDQRPCIVVQRTLVSNLGVQLVCYQSLLVHQLRGPCRGGVQSYKSPRRQLSMSCDQRQSASPTGRLVPPDKINPPSGCMLPRPGNLRCLPLLAPALLSSEQKHCCTHTNSSGSIWTGYPYQ